MSKIVLKKVIKIKKTLPISNNKLNLVMKQEL